MATHCQRLFSLFFTLGTISLSVADSVFLSIDCGSSASYTDQNLIRWLGDDNYIKNGEAKMVLQPISSNSTTSPRVMDTLRVFTTRKKNCYYIDEIKKGRVLVRASFYYGNYDGKASPPAFDLILDGNPWTTVQMTLSNNYVSHEVIYVMKTASISVCVAQTRTGQFPFISALEVRALEPTMYVNFNDTYPLFMSRRFAYGANSTVRFPEDAYDRIWSPVSYGFPTLSGNATFTVTGLADNPPPAVLRSAITTATPNSSIPLFLPLPPIEIPIYVNFYFSEIIHLGPNDVRSLRIFKDENQSFSPPIIPPYQNFSEMYIRGLLDSSNATFSIVSDNNSTLPPLINALELFLVGPELTNGTDKRDVAGLAMLQKAFDVLQGWRGDPCMPAPYSWDWINCSTNSTPRVSALFLDSFGLSGMLPDFSSMDALQTIDLHNNSLNGPIPEFLGKLQNLTTLNLANNNFNGSIPTSLSQKSGSNLNVTGNPRLCRGGEACAISNSANKSSLSTMKTLAAKVLGISLSSYVIVVGMVVRE